MSTPSATDANEFEATNERQPSFSGEHHHIHERRRGRGVTEGNPRVYRANLAEHGGNLKRHSGPRGAARTAAARGGSRRS